MNDKNHASQIAQLANQYGRQVFHTAYRHTGDNHHAEDIVQDVFLKLFKKPLSAFDQVQHWPAYLKSMAVSASYDFLRKRLRLAEQDFDTSPSANAQIERDQQPDQQFLMAADIQQFRQAITLLNQQEAHVFLLRYLEEFSYLEIAEQLNISSSNVGVTLNRAKLKLSQLRNESHFLGDSYEAQI